MTLAKGNVQVYTGNGKGKTTAAIGLAVRSAAAGHNVFFGQFMKRNPTGELEVFALLSNVHAVQFGVGDEINSPDADKDAAAAQAGFEAAKDALTSGEYDVVILDEANVAEHLGYFEKGALLELMRRRPENVELVLTGRYASDEVIEAADLVTEMREIKHYFAAGTPARKGIEF